MTIKFGKDGKINLEPTTGNVKGIAQLVVNQFEERLAMRERKNPDWPPEKQRKFARRDLFKNIDALTEKITESCRNALKSRPTPDRHDLLGRLLMRPFEAHMTDDPADPQRLPRQLVKPVLQAVRHIMGEANYQNLNEYSVKPSLEFCVVHDLERAVIDWDEFYKQNLVTILLTRLRNSLRLWMRQQDDVPTKFITMVNANRDESNRETEFLASHWSLLKEGWEIVDDIPE